MKSAYGFLAALIVFLGLPASGRCLDASGAVAAVQERYSALQGLSAVFSQESRLATLGRARRKSGTILFARGGKMRWEYDPPDPQIIVSDGENLWFYRPSREQVIVQEVDRAFTSQTPLLFLFGKGDLASEFDWERGDLPGVEGGAFSLELRPLTATPDLVTLTLEIRAEDFTVAATVLTDGFGNVTRLEFTEEKENPAFDEGLFTFVPPAGAEVIQP